VHEPGIFELVGVGGARTALCRRAFERHGGGSWRLGNVDAWTTLLCRSNVRSNTFSQSGFHDTNRIVVRKAITSSNKLGTIWSDRSEKVVARSERPRGRSPKIDVPARRGSFSLSPYSAPLLASVG
jgi:hypothetical protein